MRSRRRAVHAAQQTRAPHRGHGQGDGLAREAAQAVAVDALALSEAEQLRAEIRQNLEAVNSYMAEHGSFAEMVRRHYRRD